MSAAGPDSWWFQKKWSDFRRGSLMAEIQCGPTTASVLLYDVGVPVTVAAFARTLPIEMSFVHVAWSGEMLMAADVASFGPAEPENEVRLVRPGDVTWDSKFGELGLVYGDAECRLPSGPNTVTVFGSVVSGLEELARFGRARRFEGARSIQFRSATTT